MPWVQQVCVPANRLHLATLAQYEFDFADSSTIKFSGVLYVISRAVEGLGFACQWG
jgi:hypothetical protein